MDRQHDPHDKAGEQGKPRDGKKLNIDHRSKDARPFMVVLAHARASNAVHVPLYKVDKVKE
jgi:hypothetical protein